MIDVLRGVRAEEYRKLWQRVPGSVGILLWMIAIGVAGWDGGFWLGALVLLALVAICRLTPSSLRPVELVVDFAYATVMKANVLRVLWLVLIADLWVVQSRGPASIVLVLATFLLGMILPFAVNRALDRVLKNANRRG